MGQHPIREGSNVAEVLRAVGGGEVHYVDGSGVWVDVDVEGHYAWVELMREHADGVDEELGVLLWFDEVGLVGFEGLGEG